MSRDTRSRLRVLESEHAPVIYVTMGTSVVAFAPILPNGRVGTIIGNPLFASLGSSGRIDLLWRVDHRRLGLVDW